MAQAQIDYDTAHDVLYVAIGDKSNSYGDDSVDGIVVMRDMDTDAVTGFTIFNLLKNMNKVTRRENFERKYNASVKFVSETGKDSSNL